MDNLELYKYSKENFNRDLIKIAFPIVIQQLIMVCVNLADTIMVGRLSEYAVAAVGAANQIYFVIIDCVFGFLSGCAVFAVQYWGIRDLKTLRKILGIAYSMVILFSIPMILLVYIYAPRLMLIFTKDTLVINLGVEYLRIACFTYFISGITFVISFYSRAVSILKWPTIINGLAVAINILLNYILIFGKFGMPNLGIKGAAYATVIARFIEMVVQLLYIYFRKDHPLRAKIVEMKYDKALYIRVTKTAMPVLLNEFLWVLSFTLIFAIYGKISAVALAVVQVSMTISDFFQALYMGLGGGCSVIIGQALGQGEKDLAFYFSKKSLMLTWIISAFNVTLLILTRGYIASFYSFEPETTELLLRTLVIYAVAMAPKMFTYVFICGIFRPGGDTMWCFIIDVGINWILQLPFAWISVMVLKLPLEYCVGIVAIADAVKTAFCYGRFYSKKWINVLTGR